MERSLRLDELCLRTITVKEHVDLQRQWYVRTTEHRWHDPVRIIKPIIEEDYEELLRSFAECLCAYSISYFNIDQRRWMKNSVSELTSERIEDIAKILDRDDHPAAHLKLSFSPKEEHVEWDYRRRIGLNFAKRGLGIVSYQLIAPSWTKDMFSWEQGSARLRMVRFNALYGSPFLDTQMERDQNKNERASRTSELQEE